MRFTRNSPLECRTRCTGGFIKQGAPILLDSAGISARSREIPGIVLGPETAAVRRGVKVKFD